MRRATTQIIKRHKDRIIDTLYNEQKTQKAKADQSQSYQKHEQLRREEELHQDGLVCSRTNAGDQVNYALDSHYVIRFIMNLHC